MNITALDLAMRYVGIHEISGTSNHPLVQWWLSLCNLPLTVADEVPWCSAFVNGVAWELRLPRSKSAAARSWLNVGTSVNFNDAKPGFDVVVLERGTGTQPGPEVIAAPGHVGLFAGRVSGGISVLGGNQGDQVCVELFQFSRVLGIRRLKDE